METLWSRALWPQFGAAIDMLDNALVACPAYLWSERLWITPPEGSRPPWIPPRFSEFWYVAYHTLFWLDLYVSGSREEDFAPPAPFMWTEANPAASPVLPFTREELRTYLMHLRTNCRTMIAELTDEKALQQVDYYAWIGAQPASYLEILLYTMRHVQEHASHLSLFLGQHGIPDEAVDSVARAKEIPAS